jgi:hypothetical protein
MTLASIAETAAWRASGKQTPFTIALQRGFLDRWKRQLDIIERLQLAA